MPGTVRNAQNLLHFTKNENLAKMSSSSSVRVKAPNYEDVYSDYTTTVVGYALDSAPIHWRLEHSATYSEFQTWESVMDQGLKFGLWLSLTYVWVTLLPLNLQECFVVDSASIWLGVIGMSTNNLSFHLKEYWFEQPSCSAPFSNCQGRPSSMWHTFIGTTSHSTVSS